MLEQLELEAFVAQETEANLTMQPQVQQPVQARLPGRRVVPA
jgi:hypothetical protein